MTGKEIIKKLIEDPIEELVEYGHDGADVLRCKFCLAQAYKHHHEEVEHEKDCIYGIALDWLKTRMDEKSKDELRKKLVEEYVIKGWFYNTDDRRASLKQMLKEYDELNVVS